MQTFYPAHLLRAFRQAPWRQQTQLLAGLFIGLLVLLVVGGLYLAVASRAGNAGRDLQNFEAHKAELIRENDRLRAELAQLRTLTRLASRALELGFVPAEPDQVHYLKVPSLPAAAPQPAVAAAPVAETTASPIDWLSEALRRLWGGG
jgi:hypothetical protein